MVFLYLIVGIAKVDMMLFVVWNESRCLERYKKDPMSPIPDRC